jgi:hypothetical protein
MLNILKKHKSLVHISYQHDKENDKENDNNDKNMNKNDERT